MTKLSLFKRYSIALALIMVSTRGLAEDPLAPAVAPVEQGASNVMLMVKTGIAIMMIGALLFGMSAIVNGKVKLGGIIVLGAMLLASVGYALL